MTKEELEKFEEIQDIFQTRCERICHILSPLDVSYKYVYDFSIDGDDICGHGEEYWHYGGYEKFYIYYNSAVKTFNVSANFYYNGGVVYFKSKEIAKQAIQILGEDIVKLALGI